MKTKQLIDALAEDMTVADPVWTTKSFLAVIGGLSISLIIFVLFLGIRADFVRAAFDPHVIFKFVFAMSVIATCAVLVSALLRPVAKRLSQFYWLTIPIVILAFGVGAQLATSEPGYWFSGLIGRFPGACLRNIPILAAAPFIGLMLISKAGAPTRPALAGLVIGATSGGLGAFIYAFHCPDDSALFVATWYSLAIVMMSAIGSFVGARVLRW